MLMPSIPPPGWLLVGAALSLAAPGVDPLGSETPVRPPLASDPAAVARLERLTAEVGRLGSCSAACVEELEILDTDFRADPRVRALLEQAYLKRRDWQAAIGLAEGTPGGERTRGDRVRLAALYSRGGRFGDAARELESLLLETPGDAELARQLGVVLFELGEHERAAERLEGALPHLAGGSAAEAATVLGLIALHRGDLAAAARWLRRTLESQGDSIAALGALARVLAAQGDEAGARELLARAAEMRRKLVARERSAMLMSTRARMASDAWREGRHHDSERIVLEMIAEAAPRQRPDLYRYLSAVRRDAGRVEEAEAALREAARIERLLGRGQEGEP